MAADPSRAPARPGGPAFSEAQRRSIHRGAQAAVIATARGLPIRLDDPSLAGAADAPVMGAFVTLRRLGELRACCGVLGRPMRVADSLVRAARRAVLEDVRLPPVSPTELPFLDLHVSLLHSFSEIEEEGDGRERAIEVGRHGLQIRRGEHAGLLLPSVAADQGLDAGEFLRAVCRKAGLPAGTWRDDSARLFTFEAVAFGGPIEGDDGGPPPSKLSREQIEALAGQAFLAVGEMARGGMAAGPAFDGPDEVVAGLILTVRLAGKEFPARSVQISLRPGIPLRSTLARLCMTAAAALREEADMPVGVELVVLDDPAMHGTSDAADLRGFDPARRALLAIDSGSMTCGFDPGEGADELLERVDRERLEGGTGPSMLASLAVIASDSRPFCSTIGRGRAGAAVRRPAVAGLFYPADPEELGGLVDHLLAAAEGAPEHWPVAMVPHAGLRYSGGVAAAVFRRLRIPESVIILSPKHTRLGSTWAIAPGRAWGYPGGAIAADLELAAELASAIPGLRFDAAAHEREHGIEVEIPFLARLAPGARVAGIVIGGGGWEGCLRFAEGLAGVLAGRDPRPLLLISSDMNHYAPDAENRRLDAIAIEALESLDPEGAYRAISGRKISMCGLLPATIALEAQRQSGGLSRAARVAYATSADAGADPARVVGYAGMLFG